MSDGIEDRWWTTTADGSRVKSDRHGRGNRWRARWRDPDGRQRTKSFAKKADAERLLRNVKADIDRGSYLDPAAGRQMFATFARDWLDQQTFGDKTREGVASHLRSHLLPAFGDRQLRQIKPSTVQAWLGPASRELAPSYCRLLLSTLSSILGAAVEDGLIPANPCRSSSVRPPEPSRARIDPWAVERVEAIVAALPDRYRATAVVAAGCGLRQGEAFGLRAEDVDFLGRRIHVRQQVKQVTGQGPVVAPPKRSKTRTVPLPTTVSYALAEHLRAVEPGEGGLIFTNTAGGPINRGSYNARVWKPALRAAGVEATRDHGFHQLRHHYASVALAGGVSIRALADYLGHTDPGFTLRVYAHLMPSDDDRVRQALDAAYGGAGEAGEGAPSPLV